VLNFDRSSVKHALQNTRNDCRQWPSHSFRVHQILFGRGSTPGFVAGLGGHPIFIGGWKARGEGKKKGGRDGDAPLMHIPGFALAIAAILYAYTVATHLLIVSGRARVTFH